jgi:exonuclease VII large subunit
VYGALRSRLAQGEKARVVLVTGSESIVRRDVEAALGPASGLYDLVWVQVNMASPTTVTSALQAHGHPAADAVTVVRGGGAGLEVFDDPQVARAAVSLPCPLVTALGHAVDVSLLDEVADLNLETPTRLGQWLRELAEQVASERAASLAAVQREVDALRRDLEVARRERDRLSAELLEARSRVESLSAAASRGIRWVVAALAAGMVAGILLAHAFIR